MTATGSASDSSESASGRTVALAVLFVAAAATGFSPILVRLAVAEGMGAEAAAFWRFLTALPVLAVLALISARRSKDAAAGGAKPDVRLLLLAGLFFSLDLASWHAGIVRTSVANATFLPNLTPVIVGAAAWLLFGETITRRFAAGALAALAGALMMAGSGIGTAALGDAAGLDWRDRALGDALSALTAVWYACYLLTVKAARGRASAIRVMLTAALVGAPILLAVTLAFGQSPWPTTPLSVLWVVLLGAVVHVGGQGGIAFALGRLPASRSAIVILVQPLVAALAGWALFGEALSAGQALGGALVLSGIWLATAPRARAGGKQGPRGKPAS